jgi:hypothetical protein
MGKVPKYPSKDPANAPQMDNIQATFKNSAHSFTEGADHEDFPVREYIPSGAEEQPTLDEQIAFIETCLKDKEYVAWAYTTFRQIKENLLAIKRWSSNPLFDQLDLEKVLSDLVHDMKSIRATQTWENVVYDSHIQNAEAALGMMQAFREKRNKPKATDAATAQSSMLYGIGRGHLGTERQSKGQSFQVPLVDGKPQRMEETIDHESIITELVAKLPFYKDVNEMIAKAMIYTVEEVLKSKTR